MGCKELIESLRKAADEKLLEIRQQAKGEVEELRREYSRRTEDIRQEQEAHLSARIRGATAGILSDAKSEALLIKLSSEKAIAERLFGVALDALKMLRGEGYERVFQALVKELPPLDWKTVRVNPADVALAGRHFPGATIVEDAAIGGGMDSMTEDGKIRVVNTFEKRLERAWEHMAPLLMKELHEWTEKNVPA